MRIPALDRSCEQVAVRPISDAHWCWLASEITSSDWLITLNPEAKKELSELARHIEQHPIQQLQRRVTGYAIPALRDLMQQLKHKLDHGVGFAVLDRISTQQYPQETLVEIYWILGQLIGRPVAQKWNGEMIYDVRDTGVQFQYGVRGSRTSVELLFHTDNAFGHMVPDYVGLFCKNPAKEGGISRFCSLYTLHHRLQRSHPDVLRQLYQPMLYDRQKEHHSDAPPICLAPFFSWRGDRLTARANTSLVRKGHEVAGQIMSPELKNALDVVDKVCADDDMWFEAPLEAGQIQYLNNHEIGHYRSAFTDHEEPEKKRHLFRLWHREAGTNCYDGVQLPV
ncbi:MAG: TauD/TfdA family dioxygenase [Granulosicoccus sp.]|nr:TauD/TfdA family dioxygenase [Granulosicoccus sp.]